MAVASKSASAYCDPAPNRFVNQTPRRERPRSARIADSRPRWFCSARTPPVLFKRAGSAGSSSPRGSRSSRVTPRLLSSSESLREKSPEAVGMSSASRSPGTPGRSSAPSRARSRSKSPKLPNPPGASPRAAAGDRRRARERAEVSKRGVPDVGARVHGRADRHRARVPSALSRGGGRAPPAAHPALAPSANIAAARRTEWPEACRKAPRSEAKSRSAGARRRCLAERFRHLPEITREIFRDFGI